MKKPSRRACLAALCLFATCLVAPFPHGANAQTAPVQTAPVKIGVLAVMTTYGSDISGPGAVLAAQMAVDDFGGTLLGRPVQVISGDTQQKPDIASALAAQWYDTQGVDVIVDVPNSAVALAVQDVARKRQQVVMTAGSGTMLYSGKNCSPTSFQWVFNTYALANSTGRAVVRRGGKNWFLLYADFAFGYDLKRDATGAIEAEGGHVLGTVAHPVNSNDLSSYVLRALSSDAQVIGMANSPPDNVNSIKAARDFGVSGKGKQIAVFLLQAADVHGLGLEVAQGILVTEPFYWDRDDATRAWAKRFFAQQHVMPSSEQAGTYSSTLAWLRAARAAGTLDGPAVAAKLHELPVTDPLMPGQVTADGVMRHDMYLFEVKSPAESKYPWDYYKLLNKVPAADAWQKLAQSDCPLVTK
jgi:branched-chain amino acid transport system substrate-binding protein